MFVGNVLVCRSAASQVYLSQFVVDTAKADVEQRIIILQEQNEALQRNIQTVNRENEYCHNKITEDGMKLYDYEMIIHNLQDKLAEKESKIQEMRSTGRVIYE